MEVVITTTPLFSQGKKQTLFFAPHLSSSCPIYLLCDYVVVWPQEKVM